MLISRVWLESLLLVGTDAWADGERRVAWPTQDDELSSALTSLGLEVESVEQVGQGLEAIRVAEVLAIAPHPAADKLRLVQLHDGLGTISVVCGAPNVPPPGGKVAFAPLGTVLPNGLEIAPREIRGVPSVGMICAEDELGIGHDEAGIMILPSAWAAGDRLTDRVPGIRDTIFTLGVTPNRPDALGHVGVARDLAVKLRRQLHPTDTHLSDPTPMTGRVVLEAPDRCGRYIGRVFESVSVGPSPLWLRVRLHRIGLRPINNIVDITNLVLMEWGQPLHAFDLDRLVEERVCIRLARSGERLLTLDERTLELDPDDLVIADATKPVALAGVMGGRPTSVTEQTRRVLLEAAWFDPSGVRRSARRHQCSTDSSYRFERGVDHGAGLEAAAARAGVLIQTLTGAQCVGIEEAKGRTPRQAIVHFRPARASLVLGMEIADEDAARIFTGLGVDTDRSDAGRWLCRPPSHRPDLGREEDLIEEVMRHHGLEGLPAVAAVPSSAPSLEVGPEQREAERVHRRNANVTDALCEAGLHEHLSLVFASAEEIAPFEDETPVARAVRLRNPLRSQSPFMRTHLLPGLLKALAINVARHGHPVGLFEVGRVYRWSAGPICHSAATSAIDRSLAEERHRAAVVLGAGRGDAHDVGRILAAAALRLGCGVEVRPMPSEPRPWFHPGVQAQLVRGDGIVVGEFGECHPDRQAAVNLPADARAYYGELWLDQLPSADPPQVRPLPRFPSTRRDVSIDVAVSLPAVRVVEALVAAEASLPVEGEDPARLSRTSLGRPAIDLIEDYREAGGAVERRALLIRLAYAASTRSVTDEEVQRRHEAVLAEALSVLRKVDAAARIR